MFDDYQPGREQPSQIDTTDANGVGVQSVRVMPIQGGAWALPRFHPDVPVSLTTTLVEDSEATLAKLALHAKSMGLPLPRGKFKSTGHTLIDQFDKFFKENDPSHHTPVIELVISTNEEGIEITVGAQSRIPAYLVKDLVLELNALKKGMGYWALNIALAVEHAAFPVYDFPRTADAFLYCYGGWEMTDENYADSLRERYEEDMTIEQLREEHEGLWPSDLIEDVDGNEWLFTRRAIGYQTSPDTCTEAEVLRYLKRCKDTRICEILNSFISLSSLIKERNESELWKYGEVTNEYGESPCDFIGATCFLAWGSFDITDEVYSHYEEYLMNGGEASDEHARFTFKGVQPEGLTRVINFMESYRAFHDGVTRAFSHFKAVT